MGIFSLKYLGFLPQWFHYCSHCINCGKTLNPGGIWALTLLEYGHVKYIVSVKCSVCEGILQNFFCSGNELSLLKFFDLDWEICLMGFRFYFHI